MRPDPRLARLTACLVAAGLITVPPAAIAQQAAPPGLPLAPQQPPLPPAAQAGPGAGPAAAPAPGQPAQAEISPPLRVGRVAALQGTVSFHAAEAAQWVPATLNFPVTSGNGLWTQPGAGAELQISDSRISIDAATELDLTKLDSTGVQATVALGEAYVALRNIAPGESWIFQTPRGAVTLGGDGRYGIAAGDTAHPTLITVLAGAATVTVGGSGVGLQAGPGQAIAIDGTDSFAGRVVAAQPDAFMQAMAARDRPAKPLPAGVSLPPMVARMPGCTELADYGRWQSNPDYGAVWYPQVASGWAPYRDGHWAYVAPWGWTWVDAAPWGFSPFHYGRWAQINGAWAWVPGRYEAGVEQVPQPVYAPALVTFVDPQGGALGGAAIAGFAAGALAAGAVGWLPLGPREPYYPWFHARPDWVRDVNIGHVRDPAAVMADYSHGHYGVAPGSLANRDAATVVPTAALLGSRPIAGIGHPLPAEALGRFQPVYGREPLRPGSETAGLTPAVAARLGVAAGPPRMAAPGPALAPPAGFAHGQPGARPGAVPLAVAGRGPGSGPPPHVGPPISGGFAEHPAEPGRAPEPPRAVQGVRPVEPGHPEPPRAVDGVRPVEPGHAEPPRAVEGVRPVAPGHPQPPRAVEGVRPVEPGRPPEPPRAAERVRPVEAGRPPEHAVQGLRPVEPARPPEPPRAAELARPAPPHVEAPREAPHLAAAAPHAAPPPAPPRAPEPARPRGNEREPHRD